MATPPEPVRAQLALVTTAAAADLAASVSQATLEQQVEAALDALGLIVPSYYDAAGALAVAWYDEIREESSPASSYTPTIIGDPATDWIEREVTKFAAQIEGELDLRVQAMLDEVLRLTEKEVARGFRDSITGNTRQDDESIGWSRVARAGACKLCVMLADRGAVFRETTANFAAHTDCHCAARPEFRNGQHGPEATVEQYLASTKRRSESERARLRAYLNKNYPDARG